MKILIVGAGRFGSIITELMLNDGHEVIVVDENENTIENINNTLDVLAICGNGAEYNVLDDIGMKDTDVCIACTASDEINLLVSCLAKKMGAKHTVARFRSQIPGTKGFQFVKEQLGLDLVISPDYLTAVDAFNLIMEKKAKDILILGATRIATYLTNMLLAKRLRVTIIDRDENRCNLLADKVNDNAVILNNDETKHQTLIDAGLAETDALVALTSMDEENILTSLFATEYNIPTIITKIDKASYTEIVQNLSLENVIAPRTSTALMILDYVRELRK